MDIQSENFFLIPRSTEDYTVRRHQETEQNKTKSRAGMLDQKQQQVQDNFIRVTSLYDSWLIASNITAQLSQCREKMSQHP